MNRLVTVPDCPTIRELGFGETVEPHLGTTMPLEGDTIHVWTARYSLLDRYYPLLSALVNREESRKAAGFKKPEDTRRYILRHGMVRAILGHYLAWDPEKIRFIQGINGKPDVDPDDGFPEIRFSLSRTDEMVCLGITRGSDIGLDIMRIQSRESFPAIGDYLFTQQERRWMAQAAPCRRLYRFIRIWSLKEALVKATGSDVRMMKEADVSGIMSDQYLNGCYPSPFRSTDRQLRIHESGSDAGHHRVIVTVPNKNRHPVTGSPSVVQSPDHAGIRKCQRSDNRPDGLLSVSEQAQFLCR